VIGEPVNKMLGSLKFCVIVGVGFFELDFLCNLSSSSSSSSLPSISCFLAKFFGEPKLKLMFLNLM